PYQSPVPVSIAGPEGLLRRLPANLDRPGPRWPIGRVAVPPSGNLTLTLRARKSWLTPSSDSARDMNIVATPVGTEREVPLRQACGAYVDWYTNPLPLSGDGVTEISDFPTDLAHPAIQASGIYLDGWVGSDARLVLAGGPATKLSIRGQAISLPGQRQRLQLFVNGKALSTDVISSGGTVDLKVGIPASAGDRDIHLRFD